MASSFRNPFTHEIPTPFPVASLPPRPTCRGGGEGRRHSQAGVDEGDGGGVAEFFDDGGDEEGACVAGIDYA